MNMLDTGIRHGYTAADMHRLAGIAVARVGRWVNVTTDRPTQFDTAWSGIAERMYDGDAPTELDLIKAGEEAVIADARADMRHHGISRHSNTDVIPRFATFWQVPPTDPWDERLVERIATGQILNALTERQWEAVVALAEFGDYDAAATSLGLKYGTFHMRLRMARIAFRRLWFAPETPPVVKAQDRRVGSRSKPPRTHCGANHELTPENTYTEHRPGGLASIRRCRECQAIRLRERKALLLAELNPLLDQIAAACGIEED